MATDVAPSRPANPVPPEGEPLRFAQNTETGKVHILCHHPGLGEPGYVAPREYASFAEGLADMFNTPAWMLCGVRLLVGGFDDLPAVWTAGDAFGDDELCANCVRAMGDQQWRVFHVNNRGGRDSDDSE